MTFGVHKKGRVHGKIKVRVKTEVYSIIISELSINIKRV